MVVVWIHLCDRGRRNLVPFRVLVHGDDATLRSVKDEIALESRAFRNSQFRWVDFEVPSVLESVAGGWRTVDPLDSLDGDAHGPVPRNADSQDNVPD
jgi:hypothetical protein